MRGGANIHPHIRSVGDANGHVIEVGVEALSLKNIRTIKRLKMVASHDIVNVVDSTNADLAEVGGQTPPLAFLAIFWLNI